MTYKFSTLTIIAMLIFVSCNGQETTKEPSGTAKKELATVESKKKKAHRYGGWHCPDNFGFVPVDIQKLNEVPAIEDRLPTQQELEDNKSLISVDTLKYPDARALEMKLPRVARISSNILDSGELIIVIQAIIVSGDTVVGYRFPNGGNGSAWLSDVSFLSEEEVAELGSQPFFYSKSVLKASKEEIWKAMSKTSYFKHLGERFNEHHFFASDWTSASQARLNLDVAGEKAKGFVGTVFGNVYLQIDYDRDGFHYSEKLLMIENQEDNSTELFFTSGPYTEGFEEHRGNWGNWVEEVKRASEAD